jgi:hypothetical protein
LMLLMLMLRQQEWAEKVGCGMAHTLIERIKYLRRK